MRGYVLLLPGKKIFPKVPKGIVLVLRVQLFQDICLESFEKLVTSEVKWRISLSQFMHQLAKRNRKSGLEGFQLDLFHSAFGLLQIQKSLGQLYENEDTRFPDDQLDEMYVESIWACKCMQHVLKYEDGTRCKQLAKQLAGKSHIFRNR